MTKPKKEPQVPYSKCFPPETSKTEDNRAGRRARLDALLAEGRFTPMEKYQLRYSADPFLDTEDRASFLDKARELKSQLQALRKASLEGRLMAIKELFLIATEATRMLNELARFSGGFRRG
jgi:hypothetical protein